MKDNSDRRRILGALLLAVAVVLLILGETVLTGRIGPVTTLIYWTACLLFTCGAIVCALLEIMRSFGQARREQQALIEDTLHEIEAEGARQAGQHRETDTKSH